MTCAPYKPMTFGRSLWNLFCLLVRSAVRLHSGLERNATSTSASLGLWIRQLRSYIWIPSERFFRYSKELCLCGIPLPLVVLSTLVLILVVNRTLFAVVGYMRESYTIILWLIRKETHDLRLCEGENQVMRDTYRLEFELPAVCFTHHCKDSSHSFRYFKAFHVV